MWDSWHAGERSTGFVHVEEQTVAASDSLNGDQFARQKHCLAYMLPISTKGETLYVKPNIDGEAGVHVQDFDEMRQVIKGKSAHRPDYDNATFSRAKVDHWIHSEGLYDGTHRRTFTIPAGGDLGDAERIEHRR
jgi:hypothetical protein